MKVRYGFVLSSLLAVGCSTLAPTKDSRVSIIEQSDKKPTWASISKVAYRDGDKMKFVGYFTSDGEARPSAAIHGAGLKASSMPLQTIADEFLQQNGVSEDMEDSSAKLVISTLRKNPPALPGLVVVGNYYERVAIQGTDGEREELRAFALAECPLSEYNRAKKDAIARLTKDSRIKEELNQIMSDQRERSVERREPSNAQDVKKLILTAPAENPNSI